METSPRDDDEDDDADDDDDSGRRTGTRRRRDRGDSNEDVVSDGSGSPNEQEPLALDTRTTGATSTQRRGATASTISGGPEPSVKRRSPLDTLSKVFPTRTQASLAAVLDRCQGDVLLAIDEVLQGLRHDESTPGGMGLSVVPAMNPGMSIAGAFRRPLYPPPVAHVSRSPPSSLLAAIPAYPGLFPPGPPPEMFALPSPGHAKRARFVSEAAALWPQRASDSPPGQGARDRLMNGGD